METITVPILDSSGNAVGSVQIDPNRFGGEINRQLLHDVVVMYQANQRQGTSRTKGRGEVAGSTKKIYRQKGTGNARMGAKRTPIRRGGGTAHPKRPRDFGYSMPRKMLRTATRMALLSKFLDSEATVIDSLQIDQPRTKEVARTLKQLGLSGESCLIAPAAHDTVLWKSARNLPRVEVKPAPDLNALVLLKQKRLLITKEAILALGGEEA